MKTIKTILLVFVSVLILTSCTDEPNPPVAGFTLSSNAVVAYDKVTITSTATGEDMEIVYKILPDGYVMDDETLTITFLGAGTFTIEQSVFNGSGSNTFSSDVVVSEPNNTYVLDGTEMMIENIYQGDSYTWGDTLFLKIYADGGFGVAQGINLIQVYAVAGPNSIEKTYTWADNGPIGTYDLDMIYNYEDGGTLPSTFDWFTYGDNGSDLVINLVYEDTRPNALNIYDITLSSYTLNVGYWDYNSTPATWVSEDNKTLSFYYRGPIVPL